MGVSSAVSGLTPGLAIGQGLLSFNPVGFVAGLIADQVFGGKDEVAAPGFAVGQQTGSGISGGQVSGFGTTTGGPTGLGINAYGQEVDPNAEAVTGMAQAVAEVEAKGMDPMGVVGDTTSAASAAQGVTADADYGETSPGEGVQGPGTPSAASSDGGGGGGGGKVICTELHRQGRISDEVYASDHAVGLRMATEQPNVVSGYHLWAIPVVKLMQKSKLVTKVVEPFGKAWANEMHYQETGEGKGSTLGRLIISIGVPLCGAIGNLKGKEGLTVAPRVSI